MSGKKYVLFSTADFFPKYFSIRETFKGLLTVYKLSGTKVGLEANVYQICPNLINVAVSHQNM